MIRIVVSTRRDRVLTTKPKTETRDRSGGERMANEELDYRKMSILKAVIDDYIETREPVGSRTIAKKYGMGLSSATIRNEMADLEELGYLSQPHTSAGRIPSEKGYRLYVDKLMQLEDRLGFEPTAEELEDVKVRMQHEIGEMSDQIRVASELVSRLTEYTSIAISGAADGTQRIKALQVVPVEPGKALAVIVLDDDSVKNAVIQHDKAITPETLMNVSTHCNLLFAGHRVEEISMNMINSVSEATGVARTALMPVIDGIFECIKKASDAEVHTEGAVKFLSHPEFSDVGKAKGILELLNRDDLMIDLIKECSTSDGLVIRIGSENKIEELNECSVVTATYSVNGVKLGTIGVLGPTRMDYPRVVAALEYVRKRLTGGNSIDAPEGMALLPGDNAQQVTEVK